MISYTAWHTAAPGVFVRVPVKNIVYIENIYKVFRYMLPF